VGHCAAVLKTLFSNANVSMGSVESMEQYMEDCKAGKREKWTNQVLRSWNEVKERGKTRLDGGDLVFLVEELTQLDDAFTTHFKDASYFMTTTENWVSMWEGYVEAVERYGNTVVQRPNLTKERTKMVEGMIGKLQFSLWDTQEATTMPPLPLLTRGALTAMIQSIREVSGALDEVSNILISTVINDMHGAGRG
jgi:hypothetical protein